MYTYTDKTTFIIDILRSFLLSLVVTYTNEAKNWEPMDDTLYYVKLLFNEHLAEHVC